MNVKCRYEIPREVYEHSNGDVGEYVDNMIIKELCKKIADGKSAHCPKCGAKMKNGGDY